MHFWLAGPLARPLLPDKYGPNKNMCKQSSCKFVEPVYSSGDQSTVSKQCTTRMQWLYYIWKLHFWAEQDE